MSFGKRLKELREEKKMTQEELGLLLKLSKSNISKYEAESLQPSIEVLSFLADYFNVTLDYLLGKSLLRNSNEKIAFHLNTDGLDPDDLTVIQNLIDQMRKKHKK